MNFSVLMSLYNKEQSQHLEQCLESLSMQTVLPNEIIIVEDGPLNEKLHQTLGKWKPILPIKSISLKENVGLGRALNFGLEHCKFSLVARMDTDDICLPNRFERQIEIFTKFDVDICGSWVSEFDVSHNIISAYRKTPESHSRILATSKFKNPINHPSVMYRKSAVLSVGGYEHVLYFEDYHLWLKLIDKKYKFYNIQEPLLSMRAGLGQLSRRGGGDYARFELAFLKRISTENLVSKRYALVNAFVRVPIRMLPRKVLGKIYKVVRRS